MTTELFDHNHLIDFATEILVAAGLEASKAKVVAETLVEADLMGHTTHGLQLLSPYVSELEKGDMASSGDPKVISDCGSAITWDGRYLPGAWLVHKAIDVALDRMRNFPVVTVVLQKSHHIGCLAAYPLRATQKNMMMILACSDPRNKTVAPFGGIAPVYSPNPIAAGIPTEGKPILFDISMSATANGTVIRSHKEGKKLEYPWLIDGKGNLTDDPEEFYKDPPATILPLGGLDNGYKGFALGLLVEALTGALSGNGRSSKTEKWGSSVFLQIIDPKAFGGDEFFCGEMQHIAEACKETKTRPGVESIRLPGERALSLKEKQIREGVDLYPAVIISLRKLAEKFGIKF